jgi:hypothetical protein
LCCVALCAEILALLILVLCCVVGQLQSFPQHLQQTNDETFYKLDWTKTIIQTKTSVQWR